MQLIVLGSGGWIPNKIRQTCTYLLHDEEHLILLDMGTGISRLFDYKELLNRYQTINIILSHYHHDHIAGFAYLPNWVEGKNIRIWGPGKELYGKGSKEILDDFLKPPYFPLPLEGFGAQVVVNDYDTCGFFIGDIPIQITPQQHSHPSFGITVGDFLHYATDTTLLDCTFEKAKNCHLLLHECWWELPAMAHHGHSNAQELNNLLKKYAISKTGIIHINPNWSKEMITEVEQSFEYELNVFMATDGIKIDLSNKREVRMAK